jgi:hypothetical protein
MNELFGTMDREAEDEVRKPKGAHIWFFFERINFKALGSNVEGAEG